MNAKVDQPPPVMASFAPLVGHWETSGTILDGGGTFKATDVYEWFPGGHFLLHHVDADMGGQQVRSLEIFAFDPKTGQVTVTAYDNSGGIGVSTVAVQDRSIVIDGETERFRGRLEDDGMTIDGLWEQLRDGTWMPWLETRLAKISEKAA